MFTFNNKKDIIIAENITVIDGDYTGYIATTEESIKEIYIFKNDQCYRFKIEKSLLTPEQLTEYTVDLISTIVIE